MINKTESEGATALGSVLFGGHDVLALIVAMK